MHFRIFSDIIPTKCVMVGGRTPFSHATWEIVGWEWEKMWKDGIFTKITNSQNISLCSKFVINFKIVCIISDKVLIPSSYNPNSNISYIWLDVKLCRDLIINLTWFWYIRYWGTPNSFKFHRHFPHDATWKFLGWEWYNMGLDPPPG